MANERDELNAILEEGIASYADAEPLAGMEERIFARIRAMETPRRRVNAWWAVLALGLAGMVLASLVIFLPRHSLPRPATIAAAKAPSVDAPRMRPQQVRILRPKRRLNVKALPKQKVFPTPRPETAEEHLLMAWVARDPEGAARVFESLRQKADSPLEISPIVIAPLPTGEDQ